LDAVRKFHKEPGLILKRDEIYRVIGVKAELRNRIVSNDASTLISESFPKLGPFATGEWSGELTYSERLDKGTWEVRLTLNHLLRERCVSTRAMEAYWGEQFTFSPSNPHTSLAESMRQLQRLPPTQAHDGVPYTQVFRAQQVESANVYFDITRGACVYQFEAIKKFNLKDHSNENIYYE
jgi:hypothetical protein